MLKINPIRTLSADIFVRPDPCNGWVMQNEGQGSTCQRGVSGCLGALALLLVLLCQSWPAFAAGSWLMVPKIGLYVGYDDNVLFNQNDTVSSAAVNIQPYLEINYESLLSSMTAIADFDFLQYLDQSDLNRVNQRYLLEGEHKLGQKWNARAGLVYVEDSTLNSYLEETGRVILRENRQKFEATAGLSYIISNIQWIDTQYQFQTVSYESDFYLPYDRHRLNLRYRHRLKSQQDVLSLGPSFYYRTDDRNDTSYASMDIGWERDWAEATSTDAVIGARYNTVKNNRGETEDGWGVKASFNLFHQGLVSRIDFQYFHDLKTAAAGESLNVDNFFLTYDYLLTERFSIGLAGRLVFSYNLFRDEGDSNDSRFYSLEPYLSYRLTQKLNVSLRYRYQNSSQDVFDSVNVRERNLAWIQIDYRYPMVF